MEEWLEQKYRNRNGNKRNDGMKKQRLWKKKEKLKEYHSGGIREIRNRDAYRWKKERKKEEKKTLTEI